MKNIQNIVKTGSRVVIRINGIFQEYIISNSGEIDILKGIISSESPIGKGLIGRRKDEVVEVILPENKKIKCEIRSIKN